MSKVITEPGQAGWTITQKGAGRRKDVRFAWLGVPIIDAVGQLLITGCIEGAEQFLIRITHAGAILAEAQAAPGFQVAVPLRAGTYEIVAEGADGGYLAWEASDSKSEALALSGMVAKPLSGPEIAGPGSPYALAGRMGQLFLAGDSNDSIAQFTERRGLTEHSSLGWGKTFSEFARWKQVFSLQNISLLIAPAKEEILREYYPIPRGAYTVLDDFLNRFRDYAPIFPKWELWNRRDLAWCTTDTHWTDYGAAAAASAVLKTWALPTIGLPEIWQVRQRIGDLGSKVKPPVASYVLTFLPEVAARLVFDNCVSNQGNIRIYRNSKAPQSGRLLIFGDSFGTNLAEALSGVFEEVAYAYQPAGFDPDLVRYLQPSHVLLQITQRFLHGQPATGKSVVEKAREKIRQFPDDVMAGFMDRLKSYSNDFSELRNLHLSNL